MIETFYAEATTNAAFRQAIRERVEQINVSRKNLDELCGVAAGYCSKLLAPGESKDRKRFVPPSWEVILPVVGLKLALIDDRDALAISEPMYEQRVTSAVRLNNTARKSKGRNKPKPKSARVKKAAKPKRGKPYLSR